MTARLNMRWAARAASLLVITGLLLAAAAPAFGAVSLTIFEAAAREDGSIRVHWGAATELETSAYRLYRSEVAQPADWGTAIHGVPAGGSVAPADYEYIDTAVTPGVSYYYLLEDISTGNVVTPHGPVTARVLLPGETATNTPTATSTLTSVPTATTGPARGTALLTPTPTTPPPTATRRYTNTPMISPIGTPALSAPTAAPVRRATATPLPAAQLATPTGRAPTLAPATVALPPTEAPIASVPTLAPSPQVVAELPAAGLATATLVPTREVTPIIFAASETDEASPTPAAGQAVASEGSRNMGGALAAGGAALGLAALLAALWLFMRSRKV